MVGDEIVVEGSDIAEDKLEAAICRHLGLPGAGTDQERLPGAALRQIFPTIIYFSNTFQSPHFHADYFTAEARIDTCKLIRGFGDYRDVPKPGEPDGFQVSLFLHGPAQTIGPGNKVLADVLRYRSQRYQIGDQDPAARLQNPMDFPKLVSLCQP